MPDRLHFGTTKRILKSTVNAISPKKRRPDSMISSTAPPPPPLPDRPESAPTKPAKASARVNGRAQAVTPSPKHAPTLDPVCTSVEISNYPPHLTEKDVWGLFADFHIAQFKLPPAYHRLSFPLRLKIQVSGHGEAERAVKEIDGFVMDGRKLTVKISEEQSYSELEAISNEMANEMKVRIINCANTLFSQPDTTAQILEIRESMTSTLYYAFLQGRDPITKDSPSEVQSQVHQNIADWGLVATGCASSKDPEGRLKALHNLLQHVERHGNAWRTWNSWEGSKLLSYEY